MDASAIRCHYEILNVPRDADAATVKKSHRKLALRYHPDKNYGDEEAAKQFRLVQQAYECLSDPVERRWYDEHRDVVLRGGKVGGGGKGDVVGGVGFLFDTTPFHFSGCYNGYGDGEDGFYMTYKVLFNKVMEGEKEGWVSEGNIDEHEMTNHHLLLIDFGNVSSEWSDVSAFYNRWECFSSCLSFAWADKYDSREVESRWQRRRVEEENKRARKVAKRERNEAIINLVAFVKKTDPRVKAARELAEKEKWDREVLRKEEAIVKKVKAAAAKEVWLLEREEAMNEAEMEDLNAGRIRLADLEDSDDDYRDRKGKRRGKRRGKKGKRKQWSDTESDNEENATPPAQTDGDADNGCAANEEEENEDGTLNHEKEGEDNSTTPDLSIEVTDEGCTANNDENDDTLNHATETLSNEEINPNNIESFDNDDSSYDKTDEEEVQDIWRCECCRKDFKSDNQLANHLKSKKHKVKFKKWSDKN